MPIILPEESNGGSQWKTSRYALAEVSPARGLGGGATDSGVRVRSGRLLLRLGQDEDRICQRQVVTHRAYVAELDHCRQSALAQGATITQGGGWRTHLAPNHERWNCACCEHPNRPQKLIPWCERFGGTLRRAHPESAHRHRVPADHVVWRAAILGGLHHEYWLGKMAA